MIFTPGNKTLNILSAYHILIIHIAIAVVVCLFFDRKLDMFINLLPYTLPVSMSIGLIILRYHTKIIYPLLLPMTINIFMLVSFLILYYFTRIDDLGAGVLIFYFLSIFSLVTTYQNFSQIVKIGVCLKGDTDVINETQIEEVIYHWMTLDRITHDQMHLIYDYCAAVAFRDNKINTYSITDEVVTNSRFNRNGHDLYKILEKSQSIIG